MREVNDLIEEARQSCDQGNCLWGDMVTDVIGDLMNEYGWPYIDSNGCTTIWCVTTLEWIYKEFGIKDKSIKEKRMSLFVNSISNMDFDAYWEWYYDKLYSLGFTKDKLVYFMEIVDKYGEILSRKVNAA